MEIDASNSVLGNIKRYVQTCRERQQEAMDVEDQASSAVQTRLTVTIDDLERRQEQRRAERDQLKARVSSSSMTAPSSDLRERLKQMRALTVAYERMATESPDLPDARSALQPLLAAQIILKTIDAEKADVSSSLSLIERAEQQLSHEASQRADAQAIAHAAQDRTASLHHAQRENLTKTSVDKVKELLESKAKRKRAFEQDTKKLRTVLNDFVRNHLAAMLVAEENGGPVAGALADIAEDTLAAEASTQNPTRANHPTDSMRQRRLDEVWGNTTVMEHGPHESESDAVLQEMQQLLELLMESNNYVALARDSAAARFLVRAKIAQFYPKDARRLKLVDFARELGE